jgi:Listeria/Bacterioides repeat
MEDSMRGLGLWGRAAMVAAVFAGTAFAQVKHVAVVETEIDPTAKINKAEAMEITATLRREAINNLPRGKYNIMTTETIQAMGGAVLDKCAEENCVISLGETIGADYIVRGIVRKIGTKLSLTVEMHEIDRGMLIALSDPVRAENIEDLLDKAAAACAAMYKKFLNERGTAAQPQPKSEPEPKPPIKYTITAAVNPIGGGTVSRNPNQTYYEQGTVVSVTAAPADGYTFTGWSGASKSANATLTAPIDRDLTLTANFDRLRMSAPTYQTPTYQTPTPPTIYPPSVVDGAGMLTDGRDGKKYKTVTMIEGKRLLGKRWMAENLNYQTASGSWCYEDNNSNCGKYGRLYDWNTAKTVCMSGWHLPSRQEWSDLVKFAGGDKKAGKKLKAGNGWNNYYKKSGNGTDNFGFSALPGGYRGSDGYFRNAGNFGYWWTATEYSGGYAYYRLMDYYLGYVGENSNGKSIGFSARCVQD